MAAPAGRETPVGTTAAGGENVRACGSPTGGPSRTTDVAAETGGNGCGRTPTPAPRAWPGITHRAEAPGRRPAREAVRRCVRPYEDRTRRTRGRGAEQRRASNTRTRRNTTAGTEAEGRQNGVPSPATPWKQRREKTGTTAEEGHTAGTTCRPTRQARHEPAGERRRTFQTAHAANRHPEPHPDAHRTPPGDPDTDEVRDTSANGHTAVAGRAG